jgi:diguanylate cyclase (GGDEF)-like protein
MALIVVVDDRITNRVIFSQLAAAIRDGAEVLSFESPVEVLAWIEGRRPDLVITDYKMPGMDGAAFIERLRATPAGEDVPIIVITAYEDREFRLRALKAGATDFLQSPVDHQEFITRGRNVLRLGEQQRYIRSRADALQRDLERSEQTLETAIRDSRARLIEVIDTIPAAISATDAEGRCVFVNKHGLATAASRNQGAAKVQNVQDQQVIRSSKPILGYEEEVMDQHAQRRTMLTSKFPLHDVGGGVRHVLTTSFDITERKRAEEAMRHLAHHDTLTGLPNRLLLQQVLQAEIARSNDEDRAFALHFIDLDRFKTINDGFGHGHGDALLKETAARLLRLTRQEDTVARLGGDEFAIVQAGVAGMDDVQRLAGRVIKAISEPFHVEHHSVFIGASVGMTVAPGDADTAEQLLKNADLAMYRAKQEGRGRARFFDPEMQTAARDTVLLEIALREGMERGELQLWYQAQVDVVSGALVGTEALLRWHRSSHGVTLPGMFLPLAEDTGLIVEINRWVLGEACRQAASWAAMGVPVRVGVNMPAESFKADDVEALVVQTLRRTGLPPSLLELELTEGTLMASQHQVAASLHALRRLGVRVAVDDFGTGYSSLAYLQKLPIDRLKIDRSFVQGFEADRDGSAIVKAVIGIGRSLGMEVLAEGVETAGQLARVQEAGCQLAQGYFLGRPVPAEQFQRDHLPKVALLAAQRA